MTQKRHQNLEKFKLEGKVEGKRIRGKPFSEMLGERCERQDGGKCLEIGTNSRRSADV